MAGLDYTTRDKALWGALAVLCLASAPHRALSRVV